MVEFQEQDYFNIRCAILDKISNKEYWQGKIIGTTVDGVRYKLLCSVIFFTSEARIVPVWWEMRTYNNFGDPILNEFDFKEINWL